MLELDSRQTIILSILVLFLGRYLNRKIRFLREYNIPEPVSGGLIASILSAAIYFLADTEIVFDLSNRDALLIVFFTTIGLSARFSDLVKGGVNLVVLLVIAVVYLFVQNLTGLAAVSMTELPTAVGVIGAIIARFRPHGMARALLATAFAQTLVAVIALVAGMGGPYDGPLKLLILNGIFVALFVGSVGLFRRAARGEPERGVA